MQVRKQIRQQLEQADKPPDSIGAIYATFPV